MLGCTEGHRHSSLVPRSPESSGHRSSAEPSTPLPGSSTGGGGGGALPPGKTYPVATTSHSWIVENFSSHSALACGSQAALIPLLPFPSGLLFSLIIAEGGWLPCLISATEFTATSDRREGSATGENAGGKGSGILGVPPERKTPGRCEEGPSASRRDGPPPASPHRTSPPQGAALGGGTHCSELLRCTTGFPENVAKLPQAVWRGSAEPVGMGTRRRKGAGLCTLLPADHPGQSDLHIAFLQQPSGAKRVPGPGCLWPDNSNKTAAGGLCPSASWLSSPLEPRNRTLLLTTTPRRARPGQHPYLCHLCLDATGFQCCHGLLCGRRTVKVHKAIAWNGNSITGRWGETG